MYPVTKDFVGDKHKAAAKRRADQDNSDQARFANAENEEGLFTSMAYEQDDDEADRVWAMIDAKMEQRQTRSCLTQVSDSTLMAGLGLTGYDQEISSDAADDGATTNYLALGQARDDVLRLRLDQAGDSASGKTTVDPCGYLSSLNTVAVQNAAEIGDISGARMLLKSVVQTNPKHAPGWIAAARLEEVAKKIVRARAVLASAALNLPRSVRARRILRRALEFVRTSVMLWKAAVGLEPPDDARILLAHVVELVSLSTELWLALARLETYEKAQKVLNRARRAMPTSHEIWIAASRLEEQQQQGDDGGGAEARVMRIMAKAVASLASSGAALDREAWFAQARQCEADRYRATCQAIVRTAGNLGFDSDDAVADRCDTWAAEVECFLPAGIEMGLLERTRAARFADSAGGTPRVWMKSAVLLHQLGHAADALQIATQGVERFPEFPKLWLVRAQLEGPAVARQALSRALKQCLFNYRRRVSLSDRKEKEKALEHLGVSGA
ncbi:U4/U6 x U5 tri-snRNP complex subunit Prp1 [Coemansia spiralis]|nr:U4/U6 x U5 tri-snRNP complex subunit Prp1 [Coemansia spiralis]